MTWGGGAGAALYARSRESAAAPPAASQYVARQTITLASGSLRKSLPIVDEDIDPDDGAEETQSAEAESAEAESTEAQAAAAPDTPESEPPRSA
jgi:hypothetical protein